MQWMSNPRGGFQTLRFMPATGSLARLTLFSHASHSKMVSPQNAGGCQWWIPSYARRSIWASQNRSASGRGSRLGSSGRDSVKEEIDPSVEGVGGLAGGDVADEEIEVLD